MDLRSELMGLPPAALVCGFRPPSVAAATMSTSHPPVITDLLKWSASRMASVTLWDQPSRELRPIERAQLLDGTMVPAGNPPAPVANRTPALSLEAAVGGEHERLIVVADDGVQAPISLAERWVQLGGLDPASPTSSGLTNAAEAIEQLLLEDERRLVET